MIVRAWREVADGRRARSLRSQTYASAGSHAPSRFPVDVLPGAHTSARPRGIARVEGEEAAQRWQHLAQEIRKCDGNGRLPEARSAIPDGSFARLFLLHVRLVEGGRLGAKRRASVRGVQRRQHVRAWWHEGLAYQEGVTLVRPAEKPFVEGEVLRAKRVAMSPTRYAIGADVAGPGVVRSRAGMAAWRWEYLVELEGSQMWVPHGRFVSSKEQQRILRAARREKCVGGAALPDGQELAYSSLHVRQESTRMISEARAYARAARAQTGDGAGMSVGLEGDGGDAGAG